MATWGLRCAYACSACIVAGLAYGCGTRAFVCAEDSECAGQPGGRCEPIGHCSFPDPVCASGRRYGGHSGDFSGHCVAEDDAGTTDPDATATATGSGRDDGMAATLALDADDDASTTSALDDGPGPTAGDSTSSATGEDPPTGTGITSDAETTGAPPLDPCPRGALLEETFDAFPLDAGTWTWFSSGTATADAVAGVLQISVDVPNGGGPEYGDAYATTALPISGAAGLEVHTVPAPGLPAELFFGIGDAEVLYGFDLTNGQVITFERINPDMFSGRVSVPFDLLDHRWLRLAFAADGSLAWEASADGEQWTEIDAEPTPSPLFDVSEAGLVISCGAWEGPAVGDPLCAYDNAFICG